MLSEFIGVQSCTHALNKKLLLDVGPACHGNTTTFQESSIIDLQQSWKKLVIVKHCVCVCLVSRAAQDKENTACCAEEPVILTTDRWRKKDLLTSSKNFPEALLLRHCLLAQ